MQKLRINGAASALFLDLTHLNTTVKKLFAQSALAALSLGVTTPSPSIAQTSVAQASDNLARVCSEGLKYPSIAVYLVGFCGTTVVSKCVVEYSKDTPKIVACINHFADIVQAKINQVENAENHPGHAIVHFFHHL